MPPLRSAQLLRNFQKSASRRGFIINVGKLLLLYDCHLLGPPLVLAGVNLEKKLKGTLSQLLAKLPTVAVDAIGQNRSESHSVSQGLIDEFDRQLWLGFEFDLRRHSSPLAALRIAHPTLRQIETSGDRRSNASVADDQFHTHLAVGLLADGATILMRDAYRVASLFEPATLVDNPALKGFKAWNDITADR